MIKRIKEVGVGIIMSALPIEANKIIEMFLIGSVRKKLIKNLLS